MAKKARAKEMKVADKDGNIFINPLAMQCVSAFLTNFLIDNEQIVGKRNAKKMRDVSKLLWDLSVR